MIDNLVILSNVVLVLWVVVRAILLDTQLGWFEPAETPESGGGAGAQGPAVERSPSRAHRQKQRRRPGQQQDGQR